MQNQIRSYVRTALFVDFDNVYSNLNAIDPAAGKAFDADFTPVMLRLRAHDRRTVLLATGPSATALRSACDMVLPLEIFLNEALEIDLEQGGAAQPAESVSRVDTTRKPVATVASHRSGESIPAADSKDVERLLQRMRQELTSVVAAAQAPVPMAAAAQRIRDRLGDIVLQSRWGGHGTFRAFVQTATNEELRISGPYPPGYLVDPRRHEPLEPEEPQDPLPDSVADLAHRVARIVGVPQLTSEGYRVLFEEIAQLSAKGTVNAPLNAIEPDLRNACLVRGARIPRPAINFVLQGLQLAAMDWRQPGQGAATLAEAFADNVVKLSLNARMELTDDETRRLRAWIIGSG